MKTFVSLIICSLLGAFLGTDWTLAADGDCATPGRYPDHAVPACRGYALCVAGAGGSFTRYNLTCPLDFVFDPNASVCTDSAKYPCPSTNAHYICNTTGRFPDPNSPDCLSFVLCSPYVGGTVVPRIMNCPPRHLFDPAAAMCVSETQYSCETPSPSDSTSVFAPSPVASSGFSLFANAIILTFTLVNFLINYGGPMHAS